MFDAYNGRVKDNYRFWTGLLLVARLPPLFAIAFINQFVNEFRIILLSFLLGIAILLLLQNIWLKGVYESHLLNLLELWFLLQLIVLAIIAVFVERNYASKITYTCFIAMFFISHCGLSSSSETTPELSLIHI